MLYLTFSEGYTSSAGPALERTDLSSEAIRLTRTLHRTLPGDPEVGGLLALMLLTDARRAARTGAQGERSRWTSKIARADPTLIAEGVGLLSKALSSGAVRAHQLQAAIAARHDEAPSAAATDWPQIRMLYGLLQRMSGSPAVALNHAVAVAMVQGPSTRLALLERLDQDPRIATTACTPRERTSGRWPATPNAPSHASGPPPSVTPAYPSATTSSRKPPGSPPLASRHADRPPQKRTKRALAH